MPKYVIVGGSAAGISAVEAIREMDPVGSITVISDESYAGYSRPMISEFVSGEANLQNMLFREESFWEKNQVQLLTGRKAICIDLTERNVKLETGQEINYEKLLIATGGNPFVPKIEGTEKNGVFTFTTISDAERLVARIKMDEIKKATVVGAGLVGISVTEALVKRGLSVTLVELQSHILSLLLDPTASDIVENVIRGAGVTIITGQSVQRISGKSGNQSAVGGIILTDGKQISCDLVILAIGVAPRTNLVSGTIVKMNRGIIVDNFMQTNVPNVYASGDVAETFDFLTCQNRLLPLWPLAIAEGHTAGYNMAGKKTYYEGGTNMSTLKYFGLPIVSVGLANPKDEAAYEVLTENNPRENSYRKIVLKNNVIMGLTIINDIEKAGVLFYLMKKRINVKKFKYDLISDDFGLAKLPASLRNKMCLGCL